MEPSADSRGQDAMEAPSCGGALPDGGQTLAQPDSPPLATACSAGSRQSHTTRREPANVFRLLYLTFEPASIASP
jgi:hypothetical protein